MNMDTIPIYRLLFSEYFERSLRNTFGCQENTKPKHFKLKLALFEHVCTSKLVVKGHQVFISIALQSPASLTNGYSHFLDDLTKPNRVQVAVVPKM